MQVKVAIGTVAFMLTMIILGFATLREPARLAEFTEALAGRSIENGAAIFAGNCATCHGADGKAESCVDASNNPIACVGRPLNSAALLCGDPSQRKLDLQWSGSKRNLIYTTVAAGRPGTLMPTWSQEFGGPMAQNEVEDVTNFILNWESDTLCAQPVVTAPQWPVEGWPEDVAELPAGVAEAGKDLYTTKFGCVGCHGDPATPGSNAVGPHLGSIATDGATRVEGKSAAQYVYESILSPNLALAPQCPTGPCTSPSSMPGTFSTLMTPEELANVLAYLLGQ
ncbi:MAG: c-type cytochrome [Chloroflexota bacterium]